MFSNELLLDAGDFDVLGWSSRSKAETENDSDFFVCKILILRFCLAIKIVLNLHVEHRWLVRWWFAVVVENRLLTQMTMS